MEGILGAARADESAGKQMKYKQETKRLGGIFPKRILLTF
jgi:hypothetical protein